VILYTFRSVRLFSSITNQSQQKLTAASQTSCALQPSRGMFFKTKHLKLRPDTETVMNITTVLVNKSQALNLHSAKNTLQQGTH